MTQNPETRPERIKLVYNAQFPASTAVVLEYLLRNSEFSSRTGRQEAMDAIMAFFHPWRKRPEGNGRSQKCRRSPVTVWSGC
jgi:hypothetical protein